MTDGLKHSHFSKSICPASEDLGTGERQRAWELLLSRRHQFSRHTFGCVLQCDHHAAHPEIQDEVLDGLQQVTRDLKGGQRFTRQPAEQTQRDKGEHGGPGVVPNTVLAPTTLRGGTDKLPLYAENKVGTTHDKHCDVTGTLTEQWRR